MQKKKQKLLIVSTHKGGILAQSNDWIIQFKAKQSGKLSIAFNRRLLLFTFFLAAPKNLLRTKSRQQNSKKTKKKNSYTVIRFEFVCPQKTKKNKFHSFCLFIHTTQTYNSFSIENFREAKSDICIAK